MNPVASVISRSIKEGKWVYIEYDNRKEEKSTYFWISIKDIEPKPKRLNVLLFNQEKSLEVLTGVIYFDQIIKAEIIEGTTCPLQETLIQKIISHYADFDFLEYSGINERILEYYRECYQQDRDGSVRRYHLVRGIDADILEGKTVSLSPALFQEFVHNLKLHQKEKRQKSRQEIIRMAINVLAIHSPRGLYPIVYQELLLDVERKALTAGNGLCFNIRLNDEKEQLKFDLRHYFDGDPNQFVSEFKEHRNDFIAQLSSNCRRREIVDERPYLFKLVQFIPLNIQHDFQKIQEHYLSEQLCAPLQAFFGLNDKERRHRAKGILISSPQINMDQLRVLYNAMIKEVVYVQGPPGTGKTATIINVLTSCLLNRSHALIVSNNNEAINNIQRKCESFFYQGVCIPFPLLRLGSNATIKNSLQRLHQQLDYYKQLTSHIDRKQIKAYENEFNQTLSPLKEAITAVEERSELTEQIESLNEVIKTIAQESQIDEISKSMAILGIRAQMETLKRSLTVLEEKDALSLCNFDYDKIMHYLFLRSIEQLTRLFNKKNTPLYSILLIEEEDERMRSFRNLINEKSGLLMVLDCFCFILSTNVSSSKLAQADPIFDLLIMDEASQCSNALALLPMARCKRALFVGDQNQLQPVLMLSPEKNAVLLKSYDIPAPYDYRHNSILSTLLKIDSLSKFILLREHYRCNSRIIEFSNQKYYGGELLLKSQLHNVDALKLIDIKSSEANEKNTCKEEIQAVLQEIKASATTDIAVITPFRKQADLIESILMKEQLDYVKTGTIHTFQGDEKTKIILCSGISKATQAGSFNWLKNNQELINVATTRAKENLVLITDVSKVHELSQDTMNDFLELIQYVGKDGNVEVHYNENELFQSKVKNFKYYNTRSEEEFLTTLLHLKSVQGQLRIQSKVKITDVLQLSRSDRALFTYGNQAHFDFVVYDLAYQPLLAIEVMGTEHYNNDKVIERDRKKQEICKLHNMQLLTIRNDYVRRYSYIKETIIQALKD